MRLSFSGNEGNVSERDGGHKLPLYLAGSCMGEADAWDELEEGTWK